MYKCKSRPLSTSLGADFWQNGGVIHLLSSVFCVLFSVFCLFAAGCQSNDLEKEVKTLQQEKTDLQTQLKQSESETEQLKTQVQTLSKLPPGVRLEDLYSLKKIVITRYTNIYKKDKKEMLLVYFQPIDEQDDIVKATGSVDVELWNLNKPENEAKLGSWHVTPAELKHLWCATFLTINYRLPFDVTGLVTGKEKDLVVKVTFTDYVSGKVFKEQKIIKP
jgi:hypothetical protein